MKIVYTKHALKKFADLAQLGVIVSKSRIRAVLTNSLRIDRESDYPKIIATGKLDKTRVLRVVYRQENDTIIVITFYPGGEKRYL